MRRIAKRIVFISILVCIVSVPLLSYAGWEGPWNVVMGNWGAEEKQFFSGPSYLSYSFPRNFAVTQNGEIIIADRGNKRIVVYNYDGTLKTIIEKPSELPGEDSKKGWPPDFYACSKGGNIIMSCDYERVSRGIRPLRKCVIDYNGNIKAKVKWGRLFTIENGFVIRNNGIYLFYSPIGELVKTYKERPLELGAVKERKISEISYNTIVKYPDKEWTITGEGKWPEYKRIGDCELYSIGKRQIARFDSDGNEQGRLTVPEDRGKEISRGPGVEPRYDLIEEYGNPVVAPNGDVYCWKRTPDTYSILKWVWTDGPDAPVVTAVSPSKDGLKVSWQPPEQNAEEVEGYEIVRSTDVCGPFKPIESVAQKILQYNDKTVEKDTTYYYQIQAIKKGGYSGYSNKAVGLKK